MAEDKPTDDVPKKDKEPISGKGKQVIIFLVLLLVMVLLLPLLIQSKH